MMTKPAAVKFALTALMALSTTLLLSACHTRAVSQDVPKDKAAVTESDKSVATPEEITQEECGCGCGKPADTCGCGWNGAAQEAEPTVAGVNFDESELQALYQSGKKTELKARAGEIFAQIDAFESSYAGNPETHTYLASLIGRKGFIQHEYLADYKGAVKSYNRVLERYCGNGEDCLYMRADSAEGALNAGNKKDAIKRAQLVLNTVEPEFKNAPIMHFIIWLANGKESVKSVRKSIDAVPQQTKFTWAFNGTRRATLPRLGKTKRAQATCFIDYFEADERDEAKLDVCLKKAR